MLMMLVCIRVDGSSACVCECVICWVLLWMSHRQVEVMVVHRSSLILSPLFLFSTFSFHFSSIYNSILLHWEPRPLILLLFSPCMYVRIPRIRYVDFSSSKSLLYSSSLSSSLSISFSTYVSFSSFSFFDSFP